MYLKIGTFLRNCADTIHCVGECISYNIIQKYFLKSCFVGKSFSPKMGVMYKNMCNVKYISGTEVFLDTFFCIKR